MKTEKPTKTVYALTIKFAREENGNLILNEDIETKYENIVEEEKALRLVKFLERQICVPEDHPLVYFSLKSTEIEENKYAKLPVGGHSRPILEYITKDEETKKDFIHEINEGHFVRRLYLCDVIKNWDYEKF